MSAQKKPQRNDVVTATDIADWVFCPESLRLRLIGHSSANQAVQRAGISHHVQKATAERVAGGSIALGRILIIIALLALLVAILCR
jgi:hypothetical protein